MRPRKQMGESYDLQEISYDAEAIDVGVHPRGPGDGGWSCGTRGVCHIPNDSPTAYAALWQSQRLSRNPAKADVVRREVEEPRRHKLGGLVPQPWQTGPCRYPESRLRN